MGQNYKRFLAFLDYQGSDAKKKSIEEISLVTSSSSRKMWIEVKMHEMKLELSEECEFEYKHVTVLTAVLAFFGL